MEKKISAGHAKILFSIAYLKVLRGLHTNENIHGKVFESLYSLNENLILISNLEGGKGVFQNHFQE